MTHAFSRIVKYTFCCNTPLYSNGNIVYLGILTCDNPSKSISQCPPIALTSA